MAEVVREQLGSYMSAECFRYLRQWAEETAGRGLIVQAGKQRGLSLADHLKGLSNDSLPQVAETLNRVLGKEGTRLCIVDSVTATPGGYRVQISESACSTGMKTSEPNCAFTLGVFIGALEYVGGKRLNASESECVACGGQHCIYDLEVI